MNVAKAKNDLAARFGTGAVYAEASSATSAGATAGAALAGISRVPLTWAAGATGVITASAPFTGLTNGQTIGSVNLYDLATAGTLFETIDVTDVTMPAPGAVTAALTYTQQ